MQSPSLELLRNIVALSADQAAPLLLGHTIVSQHGGQTIEAMITEVEAYTQDDPASHAHRGPTKRNGAMFENAGNLYVYVSYGMHYCMNIVCGPKGRGEGVLIRAVDILEGLPLSVLRRYGDITPTPQQLKNLTNGPGKVTQALGVTMTDYGTDLFDARSNVSLHVGSSERSFAIKQTPRIGISKAKDTPWRWYI